MSLDLLGDDFDLHGGGIDLAFPHHENERVQAIGIGRPFARHWTHSGLLVTESGEKMSKSVGNTLSLPELLEAYDPRAFRLQVLGAHYRSPVTAGEATITAATAAVERLDTFAREFAGARGHAPDPDAVAHFSARMDDDLDTPGALAGAFDLLPRARQAAGEEAGRLAAAAFEIFERGLGLPLRSAVDALPPEAEAKARARDEARRAKEWARADELRAELQADGWIVEDGPSGTVIRR
jgi:cysteinyl-tRNA synthetase